jgi:hypothetical protein
MISVLRQDETEEILLQKKPPDNKHGGFSAKPVK